VLERPRTGRELVEATNVSKATVYRRLDRLQAAGIVDARLKLDTDGHHRKQFHTTAESIQVGLGPDGLAASVEFGDDSRPRGVSHSDD
jgi:HTH domain.